MHDQPHCIVQLLGLGESAVAALVCQDPDTGEDEALHRRVGDPGGEAQVGVGEERDESNGEVDENRDIEVVTDYICHGAKNRRLEAMSWNGVVDLLHGEGGQLELIAMEIQMLDFLCCWSHLV